MYHMLRRDTVSLPHGGNLAFQMSLYELPCCAFYKNENAEHRPGTRVQGGTAMSLNSRKQTSILIFTTESSPRQEPAPLKPKNQHRNGPAALQVSTHALLSFPVEYYFPGSVHPPHNHAKA